MSNESRSGKQQIPAAPGSLQGNGTDREPGGNRVMHNLQETTGKDGSHREPGGNQDYPVPPVPPLQGERGTESGAGEIPILPSYDVGPQTVVWCGHCRQWHWHGIGDGLVGDHCWYDDSPYRKTGYITRSVGRWSDEVEAQHTDELERSWRARRQWLKLGGDRGVVSWLDVYEGRVGSVSGGRDERATRVDRIRGGRW